jgi:hypothetical protein
LTFFVLFAIFLHTVISFFSLICSYTNDLHAILHIENTGIFGPGKQQCGFINVNLNICFPQSQSMGNIIERR